MKGKVVVLICALTCFFSVGLGAAAGFVAASQIKSDVPGQAVVQAPQSTTPEETQAQQQTVPQYVPSGQSAVDVAQMCTKSVVNITIMAEQKSYTGGSTVAETVLGHGTGVIIREDGYIVTCHHVVDGADKIVVTMDDSTELEATLVGQDERFDLAVIRVDKTGLPAATVGDSDAMVSGEGVVIIGNPLGEFGSSVSTGVLSAPTRELTIEGTPLRLMQTDAAVNPGNSGGGMFNMKGELVGIVNAKIAASGIEGIGFAIPMSTINSKVESLISSGTSGEKAVLGVGTRTATCSVDGKVVECVEVTSLRSGGAAETAGVKEGDYILSVDGKAVKSNDDLTLVIKYHAPGDEVELEICRSGKTMKIKVVLAAG